ncbi:MAG: hypothetical protein HOP29_19660, partial [Phycisphaerales bacterium]|nr:hypothetical protein [Phycisphaerales bacterium]
GGGVRRAKRRRVPPEDRRSEWTAKRGPHREIRGKVEDMPRLDAQTLYRTARECRFRQWIRCETHGPVLHREWFDEGTRITKIGTQTIRLTPRQAVPRRPGAFKVTAACPHCRRQYRYLYHYVNTNGDVACRRCHWLKYRSQAQSTVARMRIKWEKAKAQHSWEGMKMIPHHWISRLAWQDRKVEDRIEMAKTRELYRRADEHWEREHTGRRGRWNAARERAKLAWRAFRAAVDSPAMRQRAVRYRRVVRELTRVGIADTNRREAAVEEMQALWAYFAGEFPEAVLEFDGFYGLERAREEKIDEFAAKVGELVVRTKSHRPATRSMGRMLLKWHAADLGLPSGRRSSQVLAEKSIARYADLVWDRAMRGGPIPEPSIH